MITNIFFILYVCSMIIFALYMMFFNMFAIRSSIYGFDLSCIVFQNQA